MERKARSESLRRLAAACILACMAASPPLAAEQTRSYTDMLGRKVTLKKDIKRIICVRYMEMYLMAALLGEQLESRLVSVGMSYRQNDSDGYRKFSEAYGRLDKLEEIGSIYSDSISLEKVILLKPDLIVCDKAFDAKNCMRKMEEAGLPVVYTDINTEPFHGEQKAVLMLGEMLGVGDKAAEMARLMNEKTDAVLARVERLRKEGTHRPRLYFECGDTPPDEIGATRSDPTNGWGYLWDRLGADNIGVGADFQAMNPETILTKDPEVIVIGGANWDPTANIMRVGFFVSPASISAQLGEYAKRPGWDRLSAIAAGRVHSLHFNYMVHPYNFAGVEAMAKFLYPEEFSDLDPEKDMADFFCAYMPVKYSGCFSGNWKERR